jgi:hypothetical protein
MILASVPAAGAIGPDGWPTGPSSGGSFEETDSIDAIRREAMAALDESRLSEDWVGDDVAANGKNGPSEWDYGPSVPHRPKVVAPAEEKEKAWIFVRFDFQSSKEDRLRRLGSCLSASVLNRQSCE